MSLRNRVLTFAAPVVIAVVWDTARLAGRIAGLVRLRDEHPGLVDGGVALDNIMRAIRADMDEQDRRAA